MGEKVCAHCGEDPYGPKETAWDLKRRVAKMEMENLANDLIFRDQLARGDNGSWPWWKWPIAGLLVIGGLVTFVSACENDISALWLTGICGLILWWIW